MKQLITLILFFIFSLPVQAQSTYAISGKVTDVNQKNIEVGDIILLSYKEKKVITYTIINNGSFYLENIKAGKFFLKVSCFGHKEAIKEIILSKDTLINFRLSEDLVSLNEIEINAEKKVFENKNGNIIVNVENTLLSKETNSLDLLSKLPKIQVSPNRSSITIIGRGNPLIYLGNQRISINELLSIAVNNIKTIELINNPSAKYDAAGRSVVLVTLKTTKSDGYKVSITETASFKTHFNNYLNTNSNFKKDNLELKLDLSYNKINVWESNGANYNITNENIFSNYLVEANTNRAQFIIGGGIFYQLNKKDYISIGSRLRAQKEPFDINTMTFLKDNLYESSIKTNSDNDGKRSFSTTTINYLKSLHKFGELFLGAQYSYYDQGMENNIRNVYTNPISETFQNRDQKFTVDAFSANGIYEKSFDKSHKLELGASHTRATSNSIMNIYSPLSSNTLYNYVEKNNSVYSQFSGIYKKINYSLGLRIEDTKFKGILNNNKTIINRKSTNLFPKINLNYAIDSLRAINLNYAKTIIRPNFSTTTATTASINPFLDFQGNLNLLPTMTDEISATFEYKNTSITVRGYQSENVVFYR